MLGSGRGGYTGLSNQLIAAVTRGELTVAQLGTAALLAYECQFGEPTTREVDGRQVTIDVGEVLFSTRSFAERHGLERDAVLRAVKSLARLGWIERRDAWKAAPPSAPGAALSAAPLSAPPPAPPPTIIRFIRDRALMWQAAEAAPPSAPPPAPGGTPPPAPIQHINPSAHESKNQSGQAAAATATDTLIAFKKCLESSIGRELRIGANEPKVAARVPAAIARWGGMDEAITQCRYREEQTGPDPDRKLRTVLAFVRVLEEDGRPPAANAAPPERPELAGEPAKHPAPAVEPSIQLTDQVRRVLTARLREPVLVQHHPASFHAEVAAQINHWGPEDFMAICVQAARELEARGHSASRELSFYVASAEEAVRRQQQSRKELERREARRQSGLGSR